MEIIAGFFGILITLFIIGLFLGACVGVLRYAFENAGALIMFFILLSIVIFIISLFA